MNLSFFGEADDKRLKVQQKGLLQFIYGKNMFNAQTFLFAKFSAAFLFVKLQSYLKKELLSP